MRVAAIDIGAVALDKVQAGGSSFWSQFMRGVTRVSTWTRPLVQELFAYSNLGRIMNVSTHGST